MKIKSFVYIFSEKVIGEVISHLAYGVEVRYSVNGIEYQVFIDDSDYVEIEDYYFE